MQGRDTVKIVKRRKKLNKKAIDGYEKKKKKKKGNNKAKIVKEIKGLIVENTSKRGDAPGI